MERRQGRPPSQESQDSCCRALGRPASQKKTWVQLQFCRTQWRWFRSLCRASDVDVETIPSSAKQFPVTPKCPRPASLCKQNESLLSRHRTAWLLEVEQMPL